MKLPVTGQPVIYLMPGEFRFSAAPALMITVLGSCVAVTMFSRRLGIGAMCHGVLPRCGQRTSPGCRCRELFRYTECAIREMTRTLERHGIERGEVEVKLFGGSDILPRGRNAEDIASVGKQNVRTARDVIESEGLSLVALDVGESFARKVIFDTGSGEVLLKRLVRQGYPSCRKIPGMGKNST